MKYTALLVCMFLMCCSEKKNFDNFNNAAWQQDKLACRGTRQGLVEDFKRIRRQLLGFTQEDIIDVLGKPDFQLLYERHQKFYVYFIEPGSQCQGQTETSLARTVSIRFSAVGLATEITFTKGKPI